MRGAVLAAALACLLSACGKVGDVARPPGNGAPPPPSESEENPIYRF